VTNVMLTHLPVAKLSICYECKNNDDVCRERTSERALSE